MRRAQVCADAISEAAREAARADVDEHDIYAAMMAAHVRAGGETPTMMLFSADRRMWQTHLATPLPPRPQRRRDRGGGGS